MDFTSLAIIKNATKTTITALDAKDKGMHVSLPVRQVERLKNALVSGDMDSHEVVISACTVMTYSQLNQFMLSCEKISVDSLSDFFKNLNKSESSDGKILKKRFEYLVHSIYFADVFTDAKIVN